MYKQLFVLLLALLSVQVTQAMTDPTRPSGFVPAKTSKEKLVLESILISDQRQVVVINGKALTVGEKIESAKVLTIANDSVRLQRGGKIIVLKPKRATVRQER